VPPKVAEGDFEVVFDHMSKLSTYFGSYEI